MRAEEFITEGYAAGYDFKFTKHFFDRLEQRDIPISIVNTILNRIGRAKKVINDVGVEKAVSVYDSNTGVHLIVKKRAPESADLEIITAYRNDEYKGKTPVVKVR